MKRKFCSLCAFMLFLGISANAAVLYVATTGSDESDGLTTDSPLATISTAVAILDTQNGGEIRLAEGTYNITTPITLTNAISVVGEADRTKVVVKNTKGAGWNNQDQRVFKINHANAGLYNLTISGGQVETGNGFQVNVLEKGGMISNCVITASHVRKNSTYGAVSLASENAYLLNSEISDITSNNNEQNWMSCTLALNISAGRAENCVIRNVKSKAETEINEFVSSRVINVDSNGKMVNCTIVGCRSKNYTCITSAENTVINCVFYDNEITGKSTPLSSKAFLACASDAESAFNDNCFVGVTAADFANYAENDFTPVSKTLINKGSSEVEYLSLTDFIGRERVIDHRPDIGAIESLLAATLITIL